MGRGGANAPGIGIDLGTTYSCVAIYRHGKVEIIVNGQGERTTPSWVAFTANEQLVGDAAKNQVGKNPTNTVYDVKRLIGRNFNDGAVQEDIELWPFKVDKGNNDKPTIVVQYKGREARFTPEQISSMVLAHMKQIADAYVGNPVTDAVITVPAYFNNAQREATKEAGTSAGLNVLRVINEPTAAAIAYSFNEKSKKRKRNVLVFDLGGGTFDVSLMSMDGEDLKVIATTGDTHLGGTDFDGRLVKHCMREFKRRSGVDVLDEPASLRKLRTACVRAKEILSFQVETTIDIDNLYESFDYQTTISRAKFESLNADLFNKCIDLVKNCLKDAEMDKSKVDEVLLVGGSTRIPRVRELLKEFFNESKISTGINADEAVASGAAINAAMLGGEEPMKFQDVVLQEVTPLPLGIGIVGGVMSVIIPKNTPIPVTKEKLFTTSFDNQTVIDFTVFEGEKISAQENHLIGEFKLSGIPEAPRLTPQIPVQFEIDASGVLTISAEDRKTKGRPSRIVIKKDARGGHENASTNVDTRTRLANYVSELRAKMEDLKATRRLRDEDVTNMLNAMENALAVTRNNAVVADEELERRRAALEVTWSTLAIQAQSSDVVPRRTEKEGGFWRSMRCCVSGSS